MKIILSDFAASQLRDIYFYYVNHVSVSKAKEVKDNIIKAIKQLIDFPYLGQKEGMMYSRFERRYLLVYEYKILYEVTEENIVILDIFHTKQSPHKMYVNEDREEYQRNNSKPSL
ncbi:type II toxin-antitoxin system RelE/ParE family toxin [Myroides odoratimimus]|uniref:Uncharacterized protein n=3 Tax=Myroides odoratimimus TaxID=76832 RepID=A0A0S7EDS9_9FLAO|nr:MULTISPECIES: type II toxin-antitoxin system RelE/ParE family toxin [Myroides]AJA69436.1 Plasmid stabilization system protein [Myroides sp. A21]ALU26694.1 hypothetical protein AS202_11280 [Myroides odoratimimus]APA92709.1 hypothetical protein BK054_10880 [Myroides sp. ZB35]EHO12811.1 hypothetical protein HMPREF9714_01181 [Myroides odoratimimus CCUG 12901]EHO12906.1 hypothetical protein HMPREF9712_00053 [Myroides odoratimimus CCUG 10230]